MPPQRNYFLKSHWNGEGPSKQNINPKGKGKETNLTNKSGALFFRNKYIKNDK